MTQKYVNYFLNNCRNIPTTNTNQGKNSSRTKGDTSREVEGQLTLMRHENLEHALRVLVPVQRLEEGEKPNYSWPHWGRVELRWLPWDKWRPHSLNQVHKYRIIDDLFRGGARGGAIREFYVIAIGPSNKYMYYVMMQSKKGPPWPKWACATLMDPPHYPC